MSTVDVESGPGYLVKRVQQALRRRCDTELRTIGLSMAQYAVLRALADHPTASASELARLCFVTRQSLQDVLRGLRNGGLVENADGPQVGRARALHLTAAGTKLLDEAHAIVIDVENQMVGGLSASAQKQLAQSLLRCAENLEAEIS
ncbi:MarR family winged helix-turn-helix transcriptional regulator [Mycolicibacterium smegmatis]|uniref:MarR-family protein transcriptional regulator n=3 Tax=Mycolicibacterium smegmatis TaxID=1772 RepID=A0QNY3_MYCS2|nr:MarR family transcriptional regulator [Mycolicibacterium smegmatis]ABK73191.1 MarR-family protein transcriptional regulator [Mycolicibacterium smegmatis MC2 155]AFP36680.1 MarR-family transcriptional regulator [Mycolicibacterium smegmatis MC2 155]AIU05485.1 MarR family transcriptional regulator [Mycolicibacterium smegmatis MC2 155]AIU12110.1 MarR family transcriptional regulator [Mycolicibacterium smegmatis]AIU18734.1 MarR family transcriptional regulator [Mycolicibacterium smegmatis]